MSDSDIPWPSAHELSVSMCHRMVAIGVKPILYGAVDHYQWRKYTDDMLKFLDHMEKKRDENDR